MLQTHSQQPMSTTMFNYAGAGLIACALVFVLIKRITRPSLSKIRGPKSTSFIYGNMLELYQRAIGQTDLEWQNAYGDVVRFRGLFGEDRLMISDPKALQRIFNTYRYPKHPNRRVVIGLTAGKGVSYVEGEDHKRQRSIFLPALGASESKAYLNIFRGCAESMCAKWADMVANSADEKAEINVAAWLSRGTLDVIGQAAFNVEFDAINDGDHPIVKVYKNMLNDIMGSPSKSFLLTQGLANYIPMWARDLIADYFPNARLERSREVVRVADKIAKDLIREKAKLLAAGEGGRDILSLLVKANMDAEAKNKLTDTELYAQMRTILFAGHATTTNTLSWALLELARHPEMQSKLRAEIRKTEAAIRARGDNQWTTADLDAMPYAIAVVKEGLRYRAPGTRVQRVAGCDDVIPLSRPITTETGEVLNEIVVPKGTEIIASVTAYHRNKECWGEDAFQFNPERWLDGVASNKKSAPVGMYSNLMTFISGPRACLGWRFAVVELQVFLVEMISRFEFTMSERSKLVCPGTSIMMSPIIEGNPELGSQMPLAVSLAPRDEEA